MLTYEEITKSEAIKTYIIRADESLGALGYTEHSFAHVMHVAETAGYILETLGYSQHDVELAKIAGYMHDLGNLVNRVEHSQSGAVMAFRILDKLNMPPEDIATIVTAIGNHDEATAQPINAISAALIIADKTDVRRSRVRAEMINFDIHDRVNYAVEKSELYFNEDKTAIILELQIDSNISPIMEYFEIFLNRMLLCKRSAEFLGIKFHLRINGGDII